MDWFLSILAVISLYIVLIAIAVLSFIFAMVLVIAGARIVIKIWRELNR